MRAQFVWRLVVDSWPTENGEPFARQGFDYWDEIARAFENNEPVPSWLPDLRPWLAHGDESPQRDGYAIAYDDPPDPRTGYPGFPEYVMNVPSAPTRTYLSRSSVAGRLADLLAWGCEAHIERAPIGEWEAS